MIVRRCSQGHRVRLHRNTTKGAKRTKTYPDGSTETLTYPSSYDYFVEAESLIADARLKLKETETIKDDNPEIYYAGFLSDARKEFCEANVTLAIISGKALPYPADLEVDATDYLNGIAEVIGELRRYILDALRNDKYVDLCEQFMEIMDEIYGVLVMVDFPEAVTNGLRRSTDAMRGVLERTRGDLTMSLRQRQLEIQLKEWEDTRR